MKVNFLAFFAASSVIKSAWILQIKLSIEQQIFVSYTLLPILNCPLLKECYFLSESNCLEENKQHEKNHCYVSTRMHSDTIWS